MSTELAKLFGISTIVYQMEIYKDTLPTVPIQNLDTLLLELLHSPVSIGTVQSSFYPPPIHAQTGFTPIPSLNILLADTWSHVASSKVAVATDDLDTINQSVWYQRITLVFPKISVRTLDWF